MSNMTSPAEKHADTTAELIDLPSDTLLLGTDDVGTDHYYSRIANIVVTVDTDGTTQREDLGDRPLQHWIAYVDEKRGWKTLQYVESIVDLFATVEVT